MNATNIQVPWMNHSPMGFDAEHRIAPPPPRRESPYAPLFREVLNATSNFVNEERVCLCVYAAEKRAREYCRGLYSREKANGYASTVQPLSDALHNLQFGNGRCFSQGKPQFNYYNPLSPEWEAVPRPLLSPLLTNWLARSTVTYRKRKLIWALVSIDLPEDRMVH